MAYTFSVSLNRVHFLLMEVEALSGENQMARCYWKGHTTREMIVEGSELLAYVVGRFNIRMLLVDSSYEEGPWNSSVDWVIDAWMPKVSELGLHKIAILLSKDVFNVFSALEYEQKAREKGYRITLFEEEEEAMQWLATTPGGHDDK